MLNAESQPSWHARSPSRGYPCGAAGTFGPDYLESAVLTDGRPARLFPLRSEHTAELVRGFERLSARSRYMRFFTSRPTLGDAQLQRLMALDGCNQFAIAVAVHTLAGFEGAAIGRLARVAGAPDTAELAITVLDEYQRLGIGGLLLARLQAAAVERGYLRVHGEVLAENRPMLRLLRAALPQLVTHPRGTVVEVEATLAPARATAA